MVETTGDNPTIVSYSPRAVKNYNAKRRLVRFENKNFIHCFE
jgi:hypothetical protein